MNALPPQMQARRDAEDRAIKLGQERVAIAKQTAANTTAIKKLLPDALAAGLTMEAVAELTKVSRQTLHQWRGDITKT